MTSSSSSSSLSLFSSDLITQHCENARYLIRPLSLSDYDKGHLKVMEQLTVVGTVTREEWTNRFLELRRQSETYFVAVVEDLQSGVIVASGTLLVERKFIRNAGLCGHIEDIVVDSSARGQNLGLKIVNNLVDIAKRLGCYKVLLDCEKKNIPFYEKIGFREKEIQMVQYFPRSKL
jgi:glucosamine-phosphate N-acetyltransferase